jgi:hypothetical protein
MTTARTWNAMRIIDPTHGLDLLELAEWALCPLCTQALNNDESCGIARHKAEHPRFTLKRTITTTTIKTEVIQ